MLPADLTYIAALRREGDQREADLYGALLAEVRLLRRRGFGVHIEGNRFRVGNRLMGPGELKEVAARERRLMGSA